MSHSTPVRIVWQLEMCRLSKLRRTRLAVALSMIMASLVACSGENDASCSQLEQQIVAELDGVQKEALSATNGDQYLNALKGHATWARSLTWRTGACQGLAIARTSDDNAEVQAWKAASIAVAWIATSEVSLESDSDRAGWKASQKSLARLIENFKKYEESNTSKEKR